MTLTPRQTEVVRLVAHGKLNKEIAFEVGIGEHSVKAHTQAAYDRLPHVRNRVGLALWYLAECDADERDIILALGLPR